MSLPPGVVQSTQVARPHLPATTIDTTDARSDRTRGAELEEEPVHDLDGVVHRHEHQCRSLCVTSLRHVVLLQCHDLTAVVFYERFIERRSSFHSVMTP
jgi:hypothetical protein